MAISTFIKNSDGQYDIIHDFQNQLDAGEIIKTHRLELNGSGVIPGSGLLDPSGIIQDFPEDYVIESYDSPKYDKVITRVRNGTNGNIYNINAIITTNRDVVYNSDVDLIIDNDVKPYSFYDFNYSFQTSDLYNAIYILPDLTTSRFRYNTEYNVSIKEGLLGLNTNPLQKSENFWFTSQYCPLFTTVTTIKLMAGPVIEGFNDDTIYRMIHKNSIDAIDIINTGGGTKLPYDYFGCTPDGVPYILRRYVECKTAYDLLNIADSISNVGLSQSKRLGDMDIKYGGAPGGKGPNDDKKKDFYDCFMGLLNLMGNGIQNTVRGLYDTSKGFPHPVHDVAHNRIIRNVDKARSNPSGPYSKATDWRYTNIKRSRI